MAPRDHLSPILFVLLLLCAAQAAAAGAPPRPVYYTDIPGITRKEADGVERLKRLRPEGLTYAMIYSDASFIDANGEVGGFSRIFCKELSGLFGISVIPRVVEWSDLVAGLDSRAFDLSGDLTATPQRREKYRMSSPIMEREIMVFRSAGRPAFDLINETVPLRCGFLKGGAIYDRVRATLAVPFTAVFVDSIREAAEAIQNGAIDAFVSEGRMDSLFETHEGIAHQEYYPLLYSSVSLSSANPEVFPLIDVFQKYLDSGGMRRMAEMHAEGVTEYLRHKLLSQLSEEEKKYVEDHVATGRSIPLAAEHDNYPASFYNEREERWQGIAHDILAEITRITGLRFEIVNAPDAPWLSLRKMVEDGRAAMATELMPTKSRQGRFLWPRSPYMTSNCALLSRAATPNMTIHQALGARVGLIRGNAHEETFLQLFPDRSNGVAYANSMEAFEALEKGEVDLVMANENLLLSITHYSERPGFKVNIPLTLPGNSYFGCNINEPALCGILDKAQRLVDCSGIAEQWKRKTFDYGKKLAQTRIPYLFSISALLVIVLGLLLALSKKKEGLSRRLSRLDHLTRLPNRRHFDEQMREAWDKAVKERMYLSLLAIDIDHFKRLNDTYGHPQGDAVLREFAGVFENAAKRHTDIVARTGGEEFSALLTNTDPEGAFLMAEKIRAAVEAAPMRNSKGGPPIFITISIGVAGIKPGPCDSIEDVTARADRALYEAKQNGRNRVHAA